MIFGRRKKYSIPRQAAGDTLKNVFAACNIETENINFDLLILKSIAQTTLVDACKWITIGFLFFTLVSPVALINNDMKIESRGIASERIIIRDHQLYKDHFILKLAGNDIDYDAIYAQNKEGTVFFPLSVDREEGIVKFPYNYVYRMSTGTHSVLLCQLTRPKKRMKPTVTAAEDPAIRFYV